MSISFGAGVPVLRGPDEARARAFYCGLLGFTLDWAQPGEPAYMQLSRGGFVLHLSGAEADARAGTRLRVHVHGLERLRADLLARGVAAAEDDAEVTLRDPFGNTLHFVEYD